MIAVVEGKGGGFMVERDKGHAVMRDGFRDG